MAPGVVYRKMAENVDSHLVKKTLKNNLSNFRVCKLKHEQTTDHFTSIIERQ